MSHAYPNTHPWIKFALDLREFPYELWLLLGEISSKCEHLAGTPLRPDVADQLHRLYLAKGVLATSAIEGNTLSEEEVLAHFEGKLKLPPSKAYLQLEITNVHNACNKVINDLITNGVSDLTPGVIKEYNRIILEGLSLEDHVVPGEIRKESVVVGRYRGCEAVECEHLLSKLCSWLAEIQAGSKDLLLPMAVIKAVLAHVYLAWIHPFGDGNGRTARLLEFHVLFGSGVPTPAVHLLSNFYNETRAEYYRQLDSASRSGGDLVPFFRYALTGFRDALAAQIEVVREHQRQAAWVNYVHEKFRGLTSPSDIRRRRLVLAFSDKGEVSRAQIPNISTEIYQLYSGKGAKTLTRDINSLVTMGLAEKTPRGVRVRTELIQAFLPLRTNND
jgi:Fic family protein